MILIHSSRGTSWCRDQTYRQNSGSARTKAIPAECDLGRQVFNENLAQNSSSIGPGADSGIGRTFGDSHKSTTRKLVAERASEDKLLEGRSDAALTSVLPYMFLATGVIT